MSNRLLCYMFLITSSFVVACDSGDEPVAVLSEEAQQIERLSKTWLTDQVVQDGFEVTQFDLQDFTITFFEDNRWESFGGAPIFESSGDWSFINGDLNRIFIGTKDVSITFSPDGRLLTLSLQVDGLSFGEKGTEGRFQFFLSEKTD